MYFHLIWIKEKDWQQYQLDFLISWGDIKFIREFLSRWGVVIVIIEENKEDPSIHWRILLVVNYKWLDVQILSSWNDIWERLYYYMFLWLNPKTINYTDTPISEEQAQQLIQKTHQDIKAINETIKKELEAKKIKENKKYEESWLEQSMWALNNTIIHIEQIKKAWEWIISEVDLKKLETYEDNIKKIRLWTNFNKMAFLLVDVQKFTKWLEELIYRHLWENKFLIDKNSYVSNIDVINEKSTVDYITEKNFFPGIKLTGNESLYLWWGSLVVFSKFLIKDIYFTFKNSNSHELIKMSLQIFEDFIIIIIVCFSIVWLFLKLFFNENFSFYYLPTFGWLGLLLFLFNSLNLKKITNQLLLLWIFAIIYRYGLILLKWTFSL